MNININSVFWTFQGEGANWGRRALFVRMPFCNLKCSWCDTEFNTFHRWESEDLIKFAQSESARFAVITGGEPMMNKSTPRVVKILKDLGFEIACESNGMFPIIDGIDFVTLSPKRDGGFKVDPQALSRANEIKVVIDDGFDLQVLKNIDKLTINMTPRLSLSPEFGNMEKSLATITEFIKENPRWRISLQTHKWMGIP